MTNRCRCGTYTNLGKNCSKCSDPSELGIEWDSDEGVYFGDKPIKRKRRKKDKNAEEFED